ncbi:hypothetical protein CGMCC3_g12238 [Colletotrichum fructicola]|uniref:Uncharacterized protein n=1 Tax=Colletotrichum chrysophilum TaxID=1836956 RepID=A0AAD9AVX3_9PEZI|nr:uncharacterized protein CGMCC3_g12238 [Colletotrichum fructicola]KAE9571619.1 hypothetical protein CGMCC3_g12238 [Colletotrichum fructicola]KAK1852769.1 hypothetical protein CCHR01_04620 [Colletotrichum chrysophilum]
MDHHTSTPVLDFSAGKSLFRIESGPRPETRDASSLLGANPPDRRSRNNADNHRAFSSSLFSSNLLNEA